MGKELDELSKALASGVSRRAAVRRFVFGSIGAAAASLLSGRTSFAQSTVNPAAQCLRFCRDELGLSGDPLGRCIQDCEQSRFNMV
jgi:hypothetical protein